MGDQKNQGSQNPNYGSQGGQKDDQFQRDQNERAGQQRDQKTGQGQGGTADERHRASNPQKNKEEDRKRSSPGGDGDQKKERDR